MTEILDYLTKMNKKQKKDAQILRGCEMFEKRYDNAITGFNESCGTFFVQDLKVLKALYREVFGEEIKAAMAATILADHYKVKGLLLCLNNKRNVSWRYLPKNFSKIKREQDVTQDLIQSCSFYRKKDGGKRAVFIKEY
jgi:hypothetical protein